MPVHGLMPGLAEVGKIKIGIKGNEVKSKDGNTFRLPKKIDYFRIVKNERDENDDYILDEQILEVIKKSGKGIYNKDGNLIEIPIRLLSNDIDLVFPTQYVSYVNGKLSCSGNGIKANTRDGRETACPCNRLDGAYTGKDKCKISGVLTCIIEGSRVGTCHKFRTTSINTAKYIYGSLLLIKQNTGGLLSFLPLSLAILPKKTIIPATGQPTTVYVVMVGAQKSYEELQRIALDMGKERIKLIENMQNIEMEVKKTVSVDTEQEEKEIAEEFFPENIETKKPSATTKKGFKDDVKEILTRPKNEKDETAKKNTSEEKVGREPVESQDKAKPDKEEDSLLGAATMDKSVEKSVKVTESVEKSEKIRKDQLVKILDLKVNKRQINDQKVWHKLIKGMKFPDVTKANDMTVEQGDKFIKYLEELGDIPF